MKTVSITIGQLTVDQSLKILELAKDVMSAGCGLMAAEMETKTTTKKKKAKEEDAEQDVDADNDDNSSDDSGDDNSDVGNDDDTSDEKDEDWEEFKEQTAKVILDDVRIAFKNFVKKQTKKHKDDLKLARKDAAKILKSFKVASVDEMEKWPEKKLKEVIAAIQSFK